MPKVGEYALKTKWEKMTRVPNHVVIDVFLKDYTPLKDSLSVDKLVSDDAQLDVLRNLLASQRACYGSAPPEYLRNQLMCLRKSGKLNTGVGNSGPGRGYKERAISLVEDVLTEEQVWGGTIERVLQALKEKL